MSHDDDTRQREHCAGRRVRNNDGDLKAGDLLAGRYRLLRLFGRGGMGEAHEALDHVLGIAVALKTTRHEAARDNDALRQLRREVLLGGRAKQRLLSLARTGHIGRRSSSGRSTVALQDACRQGRRDAEALYAS